MILLLNNILTFGKSCGMLLDRHSQNHTYHNSMFLDAREVEKKGLMYVSKAVPLRECFIIH